MKKELQEEEGDHSSHHHTHLPHHVSLADHCMLIFLV